MSNGIKARAAEPNQLIVERNLSAADLISERAKTHGDFTDMAHTAQALKSVLHDARCWSHLSAVQQEGVEMILHKLSRACNGDPNCVDHWLDIVGYSQMIVDRIPIATTNS